MKELGIANNDEQQFIDMEHKINEIIQWINRIEKGKRQAIKAFEMLGLVREKEGEIK